MYSLSVIVYIKIEFSILSQMFCSFNLSCLCLFQSRNSWWKFWHFLITQTWYGLWHCRYYYVETISVLDICLLFLSPVWQDEEFFCLKIFVKVSLLHLWKSGIWKSWNILTISPNSCENQIRRSKIKLPWTIKLLKFLIISLFVECGIRFKNQIYLELKYSSGTKRQISKLW